MSSTGTGTNPGSEPSQASVLPDGVKSWSSRPHDQFTYNARTYIEQAMSDLQDDIDRRKDLDPEDVVKSIMVRRLWHYTKGSGGDLLVVECWKGDAPVPYFLCFHRRTIESAVQQAVEVPPAVSSTLKDAIGTIHFALATADAPTDEYRPVSRQANSDISTPLAFHVTHITHVSHLKALPSWRNTTCVRRATFDTAPRLLGSLPLFQLFAIVLEVDDLAPLFTLFKRPAYWYMAIIARLASDVRCISYPEDMQRTFWCKWWHKRDANMINISILDRHLPLDVCSQSATFMRLEGKAVEDRIASILRGKSWSRWSEFCTRNIEEVCDRRRRDHLQKVFEKKKVALSQMSMEQLLGEGRRIHDESQTVVNYLVKLRNEEIADERTLRAMHADDVEAGPDEMSWNTVMERWNATMSIALRFAHRMREKEQWRHRQDELNREDDAWLAVWREAGHSCSGLPGEDDCRCYPSYVLR